MSESKRALVAFGIVVCGFISFFAWFWQENLINWILRIAPLGVISFFIYLLIKHRLQKDKFPDFLSQNFGSYFERDGFCFSLNPIVKEGTMFFQIGFQNRYDRVCEAHIALKLFSGFLGVKALERKDMDISSPPGAYGIAHMPFTIPIKFQGKKARVEIGAHVKYPEGKGNMIRFRDGIRVGKPKFTTALTPFIAIIGIFTTFGYFTPVYLRFILPTDVQERLTIYQIPKSQVVWELSPNYSLERT